MLRMQLPLAVNCTGTRAAERPHSQCAASTCSLQQDNRTKLKLDKSSTKSANLPTEHDAMLQQVAPFSAGPLLVQHLRQGHKQDGLRDEASFLEGKRDCGGISSILFPREG